MESIYIIGHGGHSKVITDILKLQNKSILGYYDDDTSKDDVVASIEYLKLKPKIGHFNYICGIGDNQIRSKIVTYINHENLNWINAIHPSAIISVNSKIGIGCMIGPGVIIQPDVEIGNHVIINSNAVIEHDCKIDDFCHIAPGSILCGNVTIGEKTLVGAGSTIIPKIKVGSNVIIGAGSTVIRNIPSNVKVAGSPTKNI